MSKNTDENPGWRQPGTPIPAGHTVMPVDEVIMLVRAVLSSAPAPLSTALREVLSRAVYRCAAVPGALQNPQWLELRDQILPPGVDHLLDLLALAIPEVVRLAEEAKKPEVDQALAALCDMPIQIIETARDGGLSAAALAALTDRARELQEVAKLATGFDDGDSGEERRN